MVAVLEEKYLNNWLMQDSSNKIHPFHMLAQPRLKEIVFIIRLRERIVLNFNIYFPLLKFK